MSQLSAPHRGDAAGGGVGSASGVLQTVVWSVSDTLVIARRSLTRYVRMPQLLLFTIMEPVMFVLLFAFVFGGAIQTPGMSYINYLIPGILVQTVLFVAISTAVALAQDQSKGVIDRFRSLPMSRAAVMAGRTIADSSRVVFTVLAMIGVGYLVGFRFQAGFLLAAGAVAIIVLFGFASSWIAAFIAFAVRDPETAQMGGMIAVFPLSFASSAFVPVESMPGWLRVFAEVQPISVVVDAVRALMLGTPAAGATWQALAWIFGILIVFIPLAVGQFRKEG